MIDRELKRSLGQMMHGVQVVGAENDGIQRLYCSHWVTQVSFDEPIVMASVSPRHDTYPLIESSGVFSVSLLAGDQVGVGQYFSYPGRKFRHIAQEYVTDWILESGSLPVVVDAIAWLRCAVVDRKELVDHVLFFATVTDVMPGRLGQPPLTYSSRLGWRIASERAREPGSSVRDALLDRLAAAGYDSSFEPDAD
ncbi:MAG: flavin reductase family protein [Actinomycetota bacterium]